MLNHQIYFAVKMQEPREDVWLMFRSQMHVKATEISVLFWFDHADLFFGTFHMELIFNIASYDVAPPKHKRFCPWGSRLCLCPLILYNLLFIVIFKANTVVWCCMLFFHGLVAPVIDLNAAPYNEAPENPVLQTVPVQIWSLLRSLVLHQRQSVVSVWTFLCAGTEMDPETQN